MSATLFEKWAKNPSNLESVRDAIEATAYDDDTLDSFSKFVNFQRVKSGDPVAVMGEYDEVGKSGAGCNPEYTTGHIANTLKRWDLGDWSVAKKECYSSVLGTFAEYALHEGTRVADLTDTEVGTLYAEKLIAAIHRMIWRIGWFGDKGAKTTDNGGVLTTGTDKAMFDVCDGLFKRIFTQCAANAEQLTAIAANAESTYAEQKAKMLEKGVATSLLESIAMDADSRITADSGAIVLATKAYTDALHHDIKEKYSINLPWEKVFDGFEITEFDGIKIARVSVWDRLIKAYENTGTALNKPYRLVYTNPRNLMVGTNAGSLLSDLDIWFDQKERMNYFYAAGKADTQLLEETLIHAAY